MILVSEKIIGIRLKVSVRRKVNVLGKKLRELII